MTTPRKIKHAFFWLSGAGTESLESCPTWEQRKYVAFGATVLVPTIFAFIACAYALSTITDNWNIIVPVSLVWSFIILTIDRALLATYRSFQSWTRKFSQFCLRFVVAVLMGLTISHPLTLLLFKDTIHSVVEEERETEIEQVRKVAENNKRDVEEKITQLEADIAVQRTKWNETFDAQFLVADANTLAEDRLPGAGLTEEQQTELQRQITEATAAYRDTLSETSKEMAEQSAEYKKIQGELDHWQVEFEREVNGQRSGIVGLGPRARSIRDDQLAWRRTEAARLGRVVDGLTAQSEQLTATIHSTEENVTNEFLTALAELSDAEKTEFARVAALKQQVQKDQAEGFVQQQDAIRATISAQIDTRLEEMARLQEEIATLANDETERIAAIRAEPRRDLLTQTLALHKLFNVGNEGGRFALTAYLVLALLFMLIDTIPLIVKFFSKPGPYDTLVDCEEVRFDREREAYLESYKKYMEDLAEGRLLHLTQNKPLEKALIEGVDRSRAAKEFLEALLEMEHAFEERMERERERLEAQGPAAKYSERAQMLEEMAQSFYTDLRGRMEHFFETGGASQSHA
ncbi:MAG: DUF4407 domain-containing protein [Verrucomicrobiota bacterium]